VPEESILGSWTKKYLNWKTPLPETRRPEILASTISGFSQWFAGVNIIENDTLRYPFQFRLYSSYRGILSEISERSSKNILAKIEGNCVEFPSSIQEKLSSFFFRDRKLPFWKKPCAWRSSYHDGVCGGDVLSRDSIGKIHSKSIGRIAKITHDSEGYKVSYWRYGASLDKTGTFPIMIGTGTGRRKGKVVPKLEWITDILDMVGKLGIPILLKNNLVPVLSNKLRQEYPAGLVTCQLPFSPDPGR
jgi:hypothetical protein